MVHRSLAHTVGSLRKFVIEPLQSAGEVKVYFHSWDTRVLNNPRAEEEAIIDPADIERILPEATGGIDSESEFDAGVDWDALHAANRGLFTDATHSGRVAFKNIVRSLESLERVWSMYSMLDGYDDGLVIATRADLRFTKSLPVAELDEGFIGLPGFHGWRGVNDRFAVGCWDKMKTYCQRRKFFEGQLSNVASRTPEAVLAAWLEKNQIAVKFLDFPFQRVRADGRAWRRDLEAFLSPEPTPATDGSGG